MSIYSGFATRQQQQLYDSYTQRILLLLQNLVHELLVSSCLTRPAPKFCGSFIKIHNHMKKMQQYKYLKPKLTECLDPLYKTCQIDSFISETKTKNIDNSDLHNISSRLDIEYQRPSLTNQKDLMLEYQKQAHKRSKSFRMGRPLTTKFTSVSKSKSSASKPKRIRQDQEDIRNVVEQYLGGTMKAGLAKAQKHYLRAYKKHQKDYGDPFSNSSLFKM